MGLIMKRPSLSISIFLCVFFLCDALSAKNKLWESRVNKSSSRIDKLFETTKVVCVGRYLLEVPKSATVFYGPASTPYHIKRFPKKAVVFNQMVEEYAKDALSRKSKLPIGPASSPGSLVGQVAPGFNDNHKIVYGAEVLTGAFYSMQSLVVVGNDVYVQEHNYYGGSDSLAAVIEELKAAAARIVPRAPEEMPSSAGACIDGALVLDRAPPHHERTTVGIRFAEFNDVHFTVDMTLKGQLVESDALEVQLRSGEENAKAEGKGEWYSRIKFIRRAERKISNWKGYEALARRPPQGNFSSFHEFAFVSQGEPNNPMLPVISLDLYTGVLDNTVGVAIPTLDDSEAVELWDKLTYSIRPNVPASK